MKFSTISILALSALSSFVAANPDLVPHLVRDTFRLKIRAIDDTRTLAPLPSIYLQAKSIDGLRQSGSFEDGQSVRFWPSDSGVPPWSHFLELVDTEETQWIIADEPNAIVSTTRDAHLGTPDAIFFRQYFGDYSLLNNMVNRSWYLCPIQGASGDFLLQTYDITGGVGVPDGCCAIGVEAADDEY